MFLIPYPGSYVSLFVQGQWTRCGEAIDPRESYVTQGASVAYTWVVGRDQLVDRLVPTGKVSKKWVHLLRWTTFPGRNGWNFGWMDRARNVLRAVQWK